MVIHGIVRLPGANYANGLTTRNMGRPDYTRTQQQHTAYREALQDAGVELTLLESDQQFPDGVFVEDTAIILDDCAIIGHAGHPTRRGEEKSIERLLAPHKIMEYLQPPGTLDGGDVLRVGMHCYIGASTRSNREGIEQFQMILRHYGYTSSVVPVETVLHLKTGASYIGNDTILSIQEMCDYFQRPGVVCLPVAEDEKYAANCLRVNGTVLMAQGFPRLQEELLRRHFHLQEVPMSEFQKMDGSLTCLSLLIHLGS